MINATTLIRVTAWITSASLVGLSMAACSGQSNEAPVASPIEVAAEQARSAGYSTQYEALRDGSVSATEYRESIDRFLNCLQESGLSSSAPILNLSDGIQYSYEITVPQAIAEADFEQIRTECDQTYLRLTEDSYLVNATPVTDAPLMAGLIDCLRASGVAVSGTETNIPELQDDPGNATGEQLTTCVTQVGEQLYPGQAIPFGFE